MKIYAISDLHVDFSENYQWLANLSKYDFTEDILVLAGDVSDDRTLLIKSFELLSRKFHTIFFVPGNHDLWVFRQNHKNSLDSFFEIQHIAAEHGFLIEPQKIGTTTIIPLYGWYDYSFGRPSKELLNSWVDFKACIWPSGYNPREITDHFIAMNTDNLTAESGKIITFSHFLPRIDLMPRFIPSRVKVLFPVLGTTLLEKQIRKLMPALHIYGHSHLNRDLCLDDIRYFNNAFGYPYETRIAAKKLQCVDEV